MQRNSSRSPNPATINVSFNMHIPFSSGYICGHSLCNAGSSPSCSQVCGRTLRVDHVRQYRRPKDEDGNEIIEKGCAPKTPTPSPTPSPEPEHSPPRAKKKKLKAKKKKQKEKKEKKSTHKRKKKLSCQESNKQRSLSPSSREDATKLSTRRRVFSDT